MWGGVYVVGLEDAIEMGRWIRSAVRAASGTSGLQGRPLEVRRFRWHVK